MRAYSFESCALTINGRQMTGFTTGDDVIQIRQNADTLSHEIGADGQMMASLSADRSGEIIFRLQQTSADNNFLMDLHNLQRSGVDFTPVTVSFRDLRNFDSSVGRGYLRKLPDMVRGANGGSQEWSVIVENLNLFFGSPATF